MATTTEPLERARPRERIAEVEPPKRATRSRPACRSIDMREPHEWDEAHLEGADPRPAGRVLERLDEVAPDHSERVLLLLPHRQPLGERRRRAPGRPATRTSRIVEGGISPGRSRACPSSPPKASTREQRMRYSRHTLLPEVGVDGQLKLLNSKVLLVGAGGLGSPAALYLAAAGVGTIGIVDDDVVDESNLQRQVIHTTERVGMPKTASARIAIEALNPDVKVVEHRMRLDASNILEIIEPTTTCSSTAPTTSRPAICSTTRRCGCASRSSRPPSSASRARSRPSSPTRAPATAASSRSRPRPSSRRAAGRTGVLGVMAGLMGLLQANEVIKLVVGIGEPLVGRLLLYDSLATRFTELKVRRDPDCPICGARRRGGPGLGDGQVPGLRSVLRRPPRVA